MKDKIVGKIILVSLFICRILLAKVELSVTDMDGNLLTQAAAGEPFMLKVFATGTVSTRAPIIRGIEEFNFHNAGIKSRSINGKLSVKHKYRLRSDKPGEYTIGPAIFSVDGQQETSNVIRVNVGHEQVKDRRAKRKSASPFLSLKLDKKEAYVGQKVTASLSFFYPHTSISLERLNEPDLNNFVIGSKTGPIETTKTLKGVEYHVLGWRFVLHPKQSGEYILPACFADYVIQKKHDHFMGLSLVFGPRVTRKRVYSNAVNLKVHSLPPHDPPVEGVGSFVSYRAEVDTPLAKEGEGIVLSLTLEGDGNFDAISAPELKNMPSCCKYYDSKSHIIEKTMGGKKGKCFEYILQIMEGGDLEIPEQEFTYFDTLRHDYKRLKTRPLHVSIVPLRGKSKTAQLPPSQQMKLDEKEVKSHNYPNNDLLPLNKDGMWRAGSERAMSWRLFFLFLIITFIYIVAQLLRPYTIRFVHYYGKKSQKKRAFPRAKKEIKRIESGKQLYPLFLELFAHRTGLAITSLSEPKIEDVLSSAGMNKGDIESWRHFFTRCAAHVYSSENNAEESQVLIEKANKWLEKLEQIL